MRLKQASAFGVSMATVTGSRIFWPIVSGASHDHATLLWPLAAAVAFTILALPLDGPLDLSRWGGWLIAAFILGCLLAWPDQILQMGLLAAGAWTAALCGVYWLVREP